ILGGKKDAKRTAVVLNVAAGLHVAKGIDFASAVKEAEETIDSGKALAKLEQFIAATNAY
ncbi:MAG: anthranilate phosphoribosyltransferase, partial [Ruminococcus sp.]|nr:anthranilate phosphoribosyltransferase [Ruminococcus sp.]